MKLKSHKEAFCTRIKHNVYLIGNRIYNLLAMRNLRRERYARKLLRVILCLSFLFHDTITDKVVAAWNR